MKSRFRLSPTLRSLLTHTNLVSVYSVAALLGISSYTHFAHAADSTPSPTQSSKPAEDAKDKDNQSEIIPLPADSITHHTYTAGGHSIAYTAHAGTLTLHDEKNHTLASLFYIAYTKDKADAEKRPVSFFFNGGPGAGSAFLNLGAAGPTRLAFPTSLPTDGANAKLKPNAESWITSTDMVFIDAPSTGFSQVADKKKAAGQFFGVKKDGEAFAKAIQLWLAQNGRLLSPRYLVGESYGGVRAIETANALQEDQGIVLNGIVMISPAIEVDMLLNQAISPLSTVLSYPSLVASHLEKTNQFSEEKIKQAYNFATGEYIQTLVSPLPVEGYSQTFYRHLADDTGLPLSVVTKQRGSLDAQSHDIRSQNGKVYSMYDFTISVPDPFPEGTDNGQTPEPLMGFAQAYGSAYGGYLSQMLKYNTDHTYKLIDMDVNKVWSFTGNGAENLPPHEIPLLRKLLALNPGLRIFIAHGYFDLVCPFGVTQWIIDHIPVNRDHVSLHLYKGGHMLYLRSDSREALKNDISTFYQTMDTMPN